MTQLNDYLKQQRHLIDVALDTHLPAGTTPPTRIHEAMRYSVFSGGKRIRPILCLAVAEALGGNPERAIIPAVALEVLHTYTLIHDDLPAMDDDNLRRGEPTLHRKFDEATAILAGDALLTIAFEWLAEAAVPNPLTVAKYVKELADAAGSRGVIAGQMEDILGEGQTPSSEKIAYIHLHKTAALFRAAVRMGAHSANCSGEQLEHLTEFGCQLGLAFQAVDDLLNVTGTAEELGKHTGTDADRGKMTYIALNGLDAAREHATACTSAARMALSQAGTENAARLTMILEELADRTS